MFAGCNNLARYADEAIVVTDCVLETSLHTSRKTPSDDVVDDNEATTVEIRDSASNWRVRCIVGDRGRAHAIPRCADLPARAQVRLGLFGQLQDEAAVRNAQR